MSIVYPYGHYRPLPGKGRTPLTPRLVNLHTMVGTLEGTRSWFSGSGRAYSHFGVAGDGTVEQWQDLQYRAASDLEGNGACISIECEDKGPGFPSWGGSDVPGFTRPQVDALVLLVSWLCDRFGLPRHLVPDSLPSRRGVSYHRLGIDPWRVGGGLRYSKSTGKVCPGDRRIAQIGTVIVPRLGGAPAPKPAPPAPPPREDTEMIFMFRAKGKPNVVAVPGLGVATFSSEEERVGFLRDVEAWNKKHPQNPVAVVTSDVSPAQHDAYMRAKR